MVGERVGCSDVPALPHLHSLLKAPIPKQLAMEVEFFLTFDPSRE